MAVSRTRASLRNSHAALIFYLLEMVAGFLSRRVFIDHIGAAVLGLNTTASNILQCLNLAELGVGAAVAFALYAPLAQGDTRRIREIVAVQGWLYRRVAVAVGAGALLVMAFFPLIFADSGVPLWYAYASFGALLFSALLTYFVNYRQIVLTASQQEYRITIHYRSIIILKDALQIAAIATLPHPYLWWLGLQVAVPAFASWNLNRAISRAFPYLRHVPARAGRELRRQYSDIMARTKQVFVHRLAFFVLGQATPLVVYAWTSLTVVAQYGNYILVLSGLTMVASALFNGTGAGVGDLLARGDRGASLRVFGQLLALRIAFAAIVTFCFWRLVPSFVTLWVGAEFVFPDVVAALLAARLYITLTRTVTEQFIAGMGMYGDVWAPVLEAALTLGLAIWWGAEAGLPGILAGALAPLAVVVLLWKPYYLFARGFRLPVGKYWGMYARLTLGAAAGWVAADRALLLLPDLGRNFAEWGLGALATLTAATCLIVLPMLLADKGMREVSLRIVSILKRR